MLSIQTICYELGKIIVCFSIGFILGWISRGIREQYVSNIDNEKLIALLISFIWALSIIIAIINPNYETPLALHGLMGGIVGFYYKQKKV